MTMTELRQYYRGLKTLPQKREFIVNLQKKIDSKKLSKKAYTIYRRLLNECVLNYNTIVSNENPKPTLDVATSIIGRWRGDEYSRSRDTSWTFSTDGTFELRTPPNDIDRGIYFLEGSTLVICAIINGIPVPAAKMHVVINPRSIELTTHGRDDHTVYWKD